MTDLLRGNTVTTSAGTAHNAGAFAPHTPSCPELSITASTGSYDVVQAFVEDYDTWDGDIDVFLERDLPGGIDGSDLIEAWESLDGDVDAFISAWASYADGVDSPCPEAGDGLHQVTDGSCDLCGSKNRD